MTTARITIRKPVDPLTAVISARRDAYARKWHVPTQSERVEQILFLRPSMAEIVDGLKELALKAERIGS